MAQVKKGPLAETSPMLNDISGLPSWTKVGGGAGAGGGGMALLGMRERGYRQLAASRVLCLP